MCKDDCLFDVTDEPPSGLLLSNDLESPYIGFV